MVLKTIGPKGPGGSNPSLSAMRPHGFFIGNGRTQKINAATAARPYHRRLATRNLA